MSTGFRVEIPGQPPSWNQSYRIIRLPRRTGGFYHSMKKTSEAESYQALVTHLTRQARPASFQPEGQIFICYQMFLKRDADCDNLAKITNDSLAIALDINDSRFLPVVLSKTSGNKEPRMVISLLDAASYTVEVVSCS